MTNVNLWQPNDSAPFYEEAESFLQDLNDRIQRILVVDPDPLASQKKRDRFVISSRRTVPATGITLTCRSVPTLYLEVLMRCTVDRRNLYVAVEKSSFKIKTVGRNPRPIATFDYLRAPSSPTVPASHINIHAPHRHVERLLHATAGGTLRTGNRAKAIRKGKMPKMNALHFPTGGYRFRPSLEDVLQFLICEFGVDARSNWESAVLEGRKEWKRIQAASVVRDDPATAVEELRRQGYGLQQPLDPPAPQFDRVLRY